jgi:hypothetical protein
MTYLSGRPRNQSAAAGVAPLDEPPLLRYPLPSEDCDSVCRRIDWPLVAVRLLVSGPNRRVRGPDAAHGRSVPYGRADDLAAPRWFGTDRRRRTRGFT